MSTKAWTPRALKHVREAGTYFSGSNTLKHSYGFTQVCSHVVSRLYVVSAREGQRFYLWTLMLHVRGATTFDEIRRVNGVEYHSFREACKAHGLLADDAEWVQISTDVFGS